MSTKKDKCEKYGIAITNYVIGEKLNMPETQLVNHLRKCARCRADLMDWKATYAMLVTRNHFAKPDTKKRMAEMIEKVKRRAGITTCSESGKYIDDEQEVKQAAGKVYNLLLEANGEMPVSLIRQKTGLTNYPFYEAVGHLITNKKVKTNRPQCQSGYNALQPK